MKRPSKTLLKLIELGTIRGIVVDHRQTGTDTAETFSEIQGDGKKKVSGLWNTFSPFLDVRVDWASVARVKENHWKVYSDWVKFEKENAAELETYNRLKAKFEGGKDDI